jgi:hypothetical protein
MPTHLTRRRALALGAAAGLGAVARPAAAVAGPGRASSFGLRVGADLFAGRGRTTPVLRAPRRFDRLGLRGRGVARAGLEVRVRPRDGAWSPWVPFGMGLDHAPDRHRSVAAVHTDPVWAGGADELQLRARRRPGALRVHFVAVPAGARGARSAARARSAAVASAAQAGAPAIIPRAAWGADTVPPRGEPSYGEVQMAFVHHTVSANTYGPADSAGIVLAIAKYHRDANGWNDIGYNLLVDQYGQVFEGRAGGLEAAVIGAQAQGWNSKSTGIATIGTWESVALPEAAMQALARVIAWKLSLHGVPVLGTVQLRSPGGAQNRHPSGADVVFQRVSGHRDGCATSCPGSALYGQLADLRARAAQLAPSLPPVGPPTLTAVAGTGEAVYGADAIFSGTLLDGTGVPLRGVPVQVQKQGSAAFVTVGRAVTGDDGGWIARVPWRRSGTVRARAIPPGAGTPVSSGALTVAVRPLLEVGQLPARVLAGRSVRVRGRVRPVGPVRVLVERQGKDGRWREVADVRMPLQGARFSKAIRLRAPGLYRLTPRTGTGRTAFRAPQVYVRAVRSARDVRGDGRSGGAATTTPASLPTGVPGTGGAAAG